MKAKNAYYKNNLSALLQGTCPKRAVKNKFLACAKGKMTFTLSLRSSLTYFDQEKDAKQAIFRPKIGKSERQ